jgi:hypothetical protein
MNTGGRKWVYLRETLLALLVVALTFLNYGHVAVSAAGGVQITPDSWCGDPLLPDSPDRSPCPACRIGSGADLPPRPTCAMPVSFVAIPTAYATPLATIELPLHARPAQPRGPPSLV